MLEIVSDRAYNIYVLGSVTISYTPHQFCQRISYLNNQTLERQYFTLAAHGSRIGSSPPKADYTIH
ncbi:MAG: hypothetical protein CO034_00270 [Parcubacteria group bacterium CG_4_9_14_0_2_um_filter_35_11]|nr:MAG: hypothetical protein CO034_00270 [Parcubacteria group bacterium CG_4_9_14_0_2_um_filter_35_11]